jgi:5-methylcytosine-specific restriction endonuclease McrA
VASGIKYSLEEVQKYFDDNECKLLEEEYVNAKTLMKYICSCGNESEIRFDDFKRGRRCAECSGTKKLSYEYVYNYFKENNCELLEIEYINNHTKMKYRCVCDNVDYINFSHFKQGHRCKKCKNKRISESNKFTYEQVRQIFEKNGCKLLSKEYVNAYQKLLFQCSCGNIAYIKYANFSQGSKCNQCISKRIAEKLKLSYEQVYNDFKKYNYELLENKYINAHIKLKYKCPEGHIHSMEYASFYSGIRCPECSLKNRSGENHYLWNPDLTNEEREYGRLISGYNEWRLSVFKRDNYTCQICSYKGCKLRAHHLNGYHWYIKGRTDINNGVTLCENCHDINKINSFHYIYGSWNNTKEQFEEFLLFKNNLIKNKQ